MRFHWEPSLNEHARRIGADDADAIVIIMIVDFDTPRRSR